MKVVDVLAEQISVDRSVERDPETERLVNNLRRRYEQVASQKIGQIAGKTYRDQGRVVAGADASASEQRDRHCQPRGDWELVPSNRVLTVGHIDHMIPFDDRLVKMELTGAHTSWSIVRRSQNTPTEEAQLIFSGLRIKYTVNARPIQKDEWYRVAVTEFLANGGDGYSANFARVTNVVFTNIATSTHSSLQCTARYADCFDILAMFASACRSNGHLAHVHWTR